MKYSEYIGEDDWSYGTTTITVVKSKNNQKIRDSTKGFPDFSIGIGDHSGCMQKTAYSGTDFMLFS